MQSRLQLFTAQSGRLSARVVFADNSVRHLHSTVKPETEADLFGHLTLHGDIIVFAGIGLGYHLGKSLASLSASSTCIVIDFYDELLDNARQTLFSKPDTRIFYISSVDAEKKKQELAAFIDACRYTELQVVKHPASFDIHRGFYEPLLDLIAGLLPAGKKRAVSPLLKVLLLYGSHFLEEELRHALKQTRLECACFPYKEYTHGIDYEEALMRAIQKEKPGFLLSVNMKGFDGNGALSAVASRFSLPSAVWFVDDPAPILVQHGSSVTKLMTAFCFEREFLQNLAHAGFAGAHYLPLAADPDMFSPLPPAPAKPRLGFVGTSMVDRHAGNIKEKFLWSDRLMPIVENVSDLLLDDPFVKVQSAVAAAARELAIMIPFSDARNLLWFSTFIIHYASMKKRKLIIGSLMPEGIETFGDPDGWRELLGPSLITHQNIDYRHGVAAVYAGIQINLNVTSCQMPTAVNQRVFDVPMAGSFLLSDRQKDLFELFDEKEIATYENCVDAREKAGYYLEHETERNRISAAARKKILARHTYSHRIRKILAAL